MDENEIGKRYLRKMRNLIRDGTHIARINDLLVRIKAKLPELEELRWAEEDGVYRFYHQSFKVFYLQAQIREAFRLIEQIGGETDPPNEWFCRIIKEGTEHEFELSMNDDWLRHTRPILEEFWHTKYFVQMMVKYAKELEIAPQALPPGWAAILYLFELR
jgi:hypothetical protein